MADAPAPAPARLAVQGFTQLATWYTQLVGDHVARVAQTVADGELDADAAAAAWTRALALPFLGLTALASEVVDATAVRTAVVGRHRRIESEVFVARAAGDVVLSPTPLTSGFGDELVNVDVERLEGRQFKLVARAVPGELVGVFRGTVVVGGDVQHPQPVWLVVP